MMLHEAMRQSQDKTAKNGSPVRVWRASERRTSSTREKQRMYSFHWTLRQQSPTMITRWDPTTTCEFANSGMWHEVHSGEFTCDDVLADDWTVEREGLSDEQRERLIERVYITNIRRSAPFGGETLYTYCEVYDADTHEMIISSTLEHALLQIEERGMIEVRYPK